MKRYRFDSADDYEDLGKLLKTENRVFILTRTQFRDKLMKLSGFVELSQHGPYMLGGNSKSMQSPAVAESGHANPN